MVTLYTRIQLVSDPEQRRDIEETGDDYDTAKAALQAQVLPGWRMLGISRWPA